MTLSDLKSRFPLLVALVGVGAISVWLANNAGQPAANLAEVARVCNLPPIIPSGWLSVLGIPQPTQPDGTGTGSCLPPSDAEKAFRKLRIAAAIAQPWRNANLGASQCAAGILAVEFGAPTVADGGDQASGGEVLVMVCG